jgi:hypothetical protein
MTAWQEIIKQALVTIEGVDPNERGLRERMAKVIQQQTEEIGADSYARDVHDTSEARQRDFRAALHPAVQKRLASEPANKVWTEALWVLDHPRKQSGDDR